MQHIPLPLLPALSQSKPAAKSSPVILKTSHQSSNSHPILILVLRLYSSLAFFEHLFAAKDTGHVVRSARAKAQPVPYAGVCECVTLDSTQDKHAPWSNDG